jgi:hypothetical protein
MLKADEEIKPESYLDVTVFYVVLSIFLVLLRQGTHWFHVTLKMIFAILFTSSSSKSQKGKSFHIL